MAENFRGVSSAVDVIAGNVISWHSIDRQIYDYAPGSNADILFILVFKFHLFFKLQKSIKFLYSVT
jgi:hypothetical protein